MIPVPHSSLASAAWFVLAAMAFVQCAGCVDDQARVESLQQQLAECDRENVELTQQVERLDETVREQERQIENLQALGGKRLDYLFVVDRIDLGRYTGGIDKDDKPGHEAIKVFLQPKDEKGHVLKAAGSVKIQLFDLALPEGENLLRECTYPVDTIAEHWSGGGLTYHYSFVCEFTAPPRHNEITVRVEFTDYLTGKSFTAQKLCEIQLPPSE